MPAAHAPLSLATGTLAWHHGDVPIDYPLENTLADVSEWLRSHPDELVLLNVWDCVPAPACMTAVRASLAAAAATAAPPRA